MILEPPARIPWYLRPGLWLARRMTGKDPLPARLLAHFPKGAVGAGVFELGAAGGRDLEVRLLAIARITASVVGGCPFCVDMNAATYKEARLLPRELEAMFRSPDAPPPSFDDRERTAMRYAAALSRTPVMLDESLELSLRKHFADREIVVLAATIAQVNFWTRFNQGLGVPAAGFFDERVCALPKTGN